MSADDLRTRIARAICCHYKSGCTRPGDCWANNRLREADAVLAVIEEPTFWMLQGALEESRKHDPRLLPECDEAAAAQLIFRAMITAARAEKEGELV